MYYRIVAMGGGVLLLMFLVFGSQMEIGAQSNTDCYRTLQVLSLAHRPAEIPTGRIYPVLERANAIIDASAHETGGHRELIYSGVVSHVITATAFVDIGH